MKSSLLTGLSPKWQMILRLFKIHFDACKEICMQFLERKYIYTANCCWLHACTHTHIHRYSCTEGRNWKCQIWTQNNLIHCAAIRWRHFQSLSCVQWSGRRRGARCFINPESRQFQLQCRNTTWLHPAYPNFNILTFLLCQTWIFKVI